MDPKLFEAMRLFRDVSPSVSFWALAGPSAAKARQAIMRALTGEKVPQAKCGINAVRDALLTAAAIPVACQAEQEDRFGKLVRETFNTDTARCSGCGTLRGGITGHRKSCPFDLGDGLDAKGLRDTQRTY